MAKHISMEVSDDLYDRFWQMKNDEHPEEGEAIQHPKALELLLDRYNGQRRPRPDVLYGVKPRIEAPHGKIYIGINEDPQGRPFEVFIKTGSSGGFTNAWCEALAKTLSSALRAGVDPAVLADDLLGIRGPGTPSIDNGDNVFSIPDAVGVALTRYIEGKLDPPRSVRGKGGDEMGVED